MPIAVRTPKNSNDSPKGIGFGSNDRSKVPFCRGRFQQLNVPRGCRTAKLTCRFGVQRTSVQVQLLVGH